MGATPNRLWVYSFDGSLVAVDGDGRVRERVPVPEGEPCTVNGQLLALVEPNRPPPPMVNAKGFGSPLVIDPRRDASLSFVVRAWDGAQWTDVEGSRWSGLVSQATVALCTATGFLLEERTPIASWTPVEGWRQATPTTPPLPLSPSPVRTSIHRQYRLAGSVVQVREGFNWRATAARFDAINTGSRPPILTVDDAGNLLIACVRTEPKRITRCVITDKP